MCMWYGGDGPTVSSHKEVTARKSHRCGECGRDIAVGERYHYGFQVYDGSAYSAHTCSHCRVAQQWLIRECGGYLIHGTWEDIQEHMTEYPTLRLPLGRLVVQANRKWKHKRTGALVPVPLVPSATAEHYVN